MKKKKNVEQSKVMVATVLIKLCKPTVKRLNVELHCVRETSNPLSIYTVITQAKKVRL